MSRCWHCEGVGLISKMPCDVCGGTGSTEHPSNPLTLVPAYGRDYSSESAVIADWEGKKDFLIQDVGCPYNGRYVDIQQARDVRADGYDGVKIRFNKKQDYVLIEV